MPLTRVQAVLGAGGLALASLVSYAGYEHYRYEKAEQQNALAMQQINELLDENSQEIRQTWGGLDTALEAAGVGADTIAKIANEIDTGNQAVSSVSSLQQAGNAQNSFNAKSDLLKAASSLQSLGMDLIQQSENELATEGVAPDAAFAVGSKAFVSLDLLDKTVETGALMIYRNQLLKSLSELESDQYTIQLRDGSERAAQMARSLMDAQGVYLRKHGIGPQSHVAEMIGKMPEPKARSQVAVAYEIVDPSQATDRLSGIGGINPDFVAAMQCDNYVASHALSDPRWVKFTCDRYPDGEFITAFGPCRGIDIPNPLYGGLISSSTGSCVSKGGSVSGYRSNTTTKSASQVNSLAPPGDTSVNTGANADSQVCIEAAWQMSQDMSFAENKCPGFNGTTRGAGWSELQIWRMKSGEYRLYQAGSFGSFIDGVHNRYWVPLNGFSASGFSYIITDGSNKRTFFAQQNGGQLHITSESTYPNRDGGECHDKISWIATAIAPKYACSGPRSSWFSAP